jgi:ABC-type transport system substrate-binding protein
MKDKRHGQELWLEWIGSGYFLTKQDPIVYYTIDHIDIENELVRKALASALQRDGIYDSLNESFKAIDAGIVCSGWAGVLEDELDLVVCTELGESEYGDILEDVQPVTWVELEK